MNFTEEIVYGNAFRRPATFRLNDPGFRERPKTGREINSCVVMEGQGGSYSQQPTQVVVSFRIELRTGKPSEGCNADTSQERDIPLLGLYDDGDYILRIRGSYAHHLNDQLATDIVRDVLRFEHSRKEPDMIGGARGRFAELFINDRYHGLYNLKEKINPKLLQLKEDGFLSKINRARKLYSILFEADDQSFVRQVDKVIEIDNYVDVHILLNLLNALDSLRKNGYVARYDRDSRLFHVFWDLDNSFIRQATDVIRTEARSCTNCFPVTLLRRLVETNAAGFRGKLKARWEELRNSHITSEALSERFRSYEPILNLGGAFYRSTARWFLPPSMTWHSTNLAYGIDSITSLNAYIIHISQWIDERLEFLDSYYSAIDEL